LPIAATPASTGLAALLTGRPGVWLAGQITAPALATAIASALEAAGMQAHFAHAFLDPFLLENALPAWEAALRAVLDKEGE
jgi:hypothetical protein